MTLIVPLRIGLSNTKNASRKCQAVVRVLFDVVPSMKKRIYLFRHGESAWNEAQRNVNVRNMMAYDHPLTEAGVAQCVRTAVLAKKPPTPTISTIPSSSDVSDDWSAAGLVAFSYNGFKINLVTQTYSSSLLLLSVPKVFYLFNLITRYFLLLLVGKWCAIRERLLGQIVQRSK